MNMFVCVPLYMSVHMFLCIRDRGEKAKDGEQGHSEKGESGTEGREQERGE